MKKVKLLYYGDLNQRTGFGQISHNILPKLHETGKFDISVLGVNYHGDKTDYPFHAYPVDSSDLYGTKIFPRILYLEKPDIIFSLQDLFILIDIVRARNQFAPQTPILGYFPIDGNSLPGPWQEAIRGMAIPVCYSEYAQKLVMRHMPDLKRLELIYHGIDCETFKILPREIREKKRAQLNWNNKFVVGIFNRFQPRKMVPLSMKAFNFFRNGYKKCGKCGNYFLPALDRCDLNNCEGPFEYVEGFKDSALYLHMNPEEQVMGGSVNSIPLNVQSLEMPDPMGYLYMPGRDIYGEASPSVQELVEFYNACDCYVSTTCGEGYGLCISKSTSILTRLGPKQIKDIKPFKDEVMSEDGKFHLVKDKVSRKVTETLKVRAWNGMEVEVTPCHPFFRMARSFKSLSTLHRHEDELTGNWVRADQLKVGDYVGIPIPKSSGGEMTIDLASLDEDVCYDKTHVWYKNGFFASKDFSYSTLANKYKTTLYQAREACRSLKGLRASTPSEIQSKIIADIREDYQEPKQIKVKRFIPINDEILYLVGWYLADGSVDTGKAFKIDKTDDRLSQFNYLNEICEKYFGLVATFQKPSSTCKKALRFYLSSKILSKFFSYFGREATQKAIPDSWMEHSQNLLPLVDGLCQGDGSFDEGSIRLGLTSEKLIWQVWQILLANGFYGGISIKSGQRSGYISTNSLYTLSLHGEQYYHFCKRLNSRSFIKAKPPVKGSGSKLLKTKDYIFLPIRLIEIKHEAQEVFDIAVEGVHSFVGNGYLLHNTAMEAMACGLPVLIANNTTAPELIQDHGILINSCGVVNLPFDSGHLRALVDVPDLVDKITDAYLKWKYWGYKPNIDAAEYVKNTYRWDDAAKKFEKLIDEIILDKEQNKNKIEVETI